MERHDGADAQPLDDGQAGRREPHPADIPERLEPHPADVPERLEPHPADIPERLEPHPVDIPERLEPHPADIPERLEPHPADIPERLEPHPADIPERLEPHPADIPERLEPAPDAMIPTEPLAPPTPAPPLVERPYPADLPESRPAPAPEAMISPTAPTVPDTDVTGVQRAPVDPRAPRGPGDMDITGARRVPIGMEWTATQRPPVGMDWTDVPRPPVGMRATPMPRAPVTMGATNMRRAPVPMGATNMRRAPTGVDMMPPAMGQMLPAPALSQQMSTMMMHLLRSMESSIPTHEVLHSLHTQVQLIPEIANLPALREFDEVSLQNLHAFVAATGYVRRIISGDRTDSTMAAFRHELEKLAVSQGQMMTAFEQLMAQPVARQNRLVRQMAQVLQMAQSAFETIQPMIVQLTLGLRPQH